MFFWDDYDNDNVIGMLIMGKHNCELWTCWFKNQNKLSPEGWCNTILQTILSTTFLRIQQHFISFDLCSSPFQCRLLVHEVKLMGKQNCEMCSLKKQLSPDVWCQNMMSVCNACIADCFTWLTLTAVLEMKFKIHSVITLTNQLSLAVN